jgi:hypothetical protein
MANANTFKICFNENDSWNNRQKKSNKKWIIEQQTKDLHQLKRQSEEETTDVQGEMDTTTSE